MLNHLLPFIRSQSLIPHHLMVQALREVDQVSRLDEKRRVAANEILPGAGDYLSPWDMTSLIVADLSKEDACAKIDARKAYIDRASNLLPTILHLLGVADSQSLWSILSRINDACEEFPLLSQSPHEKIQKQNAIENLRTMDEQISTLINLLETDKNWIDIEYEQHKSAINRLNDSPYHPLGRLKQFIGELKEVHFSTKAILYGEMSGDRPLYVNSNTARMEIVECAFALSMWSKKPKLVTTPGSDFSFLCTLIFELATGIADESLAGIINRFARSSRRKAMEEDEQKTRWEATAEGMDAQEADNFNCVKRSLESITNEREFFESMKVSERWPEHIEMSIGLRINDLDVRFLEETQRHGPFLVWASQLPVSELNAGSNEADELHERLVDLQIALGKVRRGIIGN